MKKWFRVVLPFVLIIILILIPTYAYALLDPDTKSLSDMTPPIKVFRNLAETGDRLIVFDWIWDYPTDNVIPETPASISILYRFFDTDGTTELQKKSPYVFSLINTNGYEHNVGSFYFSAADALAWDQSYVLSIQGLPAFFSGQEFRYTLTTSDYETSSDPVVNQAELKTYIFALCDTYNALYDVELKTSSDSEVVLSSYGELFFRGAIDGLQTLCPQLFFIQVYVPELMSTTAYDMSKQTEFSNRLVGEDLGRGFSRLATKVGVATSLIYLMLYLGIVVFFCIWTARKNWGVEPGLGLGIIAGIFLAVIVGDIIFTLIIIGSLIAVMGIVYLTLFKRT